MPVLLLICHAASASRRSQRSLRAEGHAISRWRAGPPHAHQHPPLPFPLSPPVHAQALARMMQPFLGWATKRYQANMANKLKDYGLRYDDLYDPLIDTVRGQQEQRWK